jgi:hypothetical protein
MFPFLELLAISQGFAMTCSIVGAYFLVVSKIKVRENGSGNKMGSENTHQVES